MVGIDIFSKIELTNYDKLHQFNLRRVLRFKNNKFSIAICVETIEHLVMRHGEKLLKKIHRIIGKVSVHAFSFFREYKRHVWGNPFQSPISQLSVEDFGKKGYDVKV